MTADGPTSLLARFVAEHQGEQIPEPVLHAARRALVDHIGAAAVVGTSMRVSPPFAAFLSAFASHVLDLDDVYNPPGTTVHGSCSRVHRGPSRVPVPVLARPGAVAGRRRPRRSLVPAPRRLQALCVLADPPARAGAARAAFRTRPWSCSRPRLPTERHCSTSSPMTGWPPRCWAAPARTRPRRRAGAWWNFPMSARCRA